jgi:hypothetical protein
VRTIATSKQGHNRPLHSWTKRQPRRSSRGLSYIQERTADGSELTDFVLSVFRDENASNKERMDAATWLADRGFGKPTVNAAAQAPGIGDFTIVIGDHDARGNPINDLPRD